MNDAADEPSKPTSAEPESRKPSDAKLRSILEKHEQWLADQDRTDLDDRRARLSGADLREHSKILGDAQLQGADLRQAQLQGVILYRARLRGAWLYGAQLQDAFLREAQLQGPISARPTCRGPTS
jgi:uncharacterized protein YjbI with pentapeptide repeats